MVNYFALYEYLLNLCHAVQISEQVTKWGAWNVLQMQIFFTINTVVSLRQTLCIPFLWRWKRLSYSPPDICPLLSSLQTAGSLLNHQQLDLMSSDLPLRMSSVPAGSRANESPVKSYTNSYLQQLGRKSHFTDFLKVPPPCTFSYDYEQRNDVLLEGRRWWRTAEKRRLIAGEEK